MKNFLLCIVLSFLVISCSNDSDFAISASSNEKGVEVKKMSQIPQNKANPFEAKGKEHFDVLTLYLKNNKIPNSINEMTDQIQFVLQNYGKLRHANKSTVSFTSEQFTMIMDNLENQFESCSLSTKVKHYLKNFVHALLAREGDDYSDLYNYIVSYETGILESTALNNDEKETILTVSSISRYALYVDPKHKDRDWETSVANRKIQPAFNSYQASIVSVIALIKTFL